MIEWIEGRICNKEPTRLVVDRGGMAISITIPLSTYETISEIGDKVQVFTYLSLKNEKPELFGFKTIEERRFFTDLLSIEGIGPYTALRILSSTSFAEFKSAIFKGDVDILSSIKGIGKKRANKLIFELREKYKKEDIPESVETTAIKALVGLGIDGKKARQLIHQIKASSLEELIKEALKKL